MKLQKIIFFLTCLSLFGCSSHSDGQHHGKKESFAKGLAKPNTFWWPEKINLSPLRQHSVESDPMGDTFDYAKEFKSLNLSALKKDLEKLMKESQDWWPADYGHYGPFFIRLAWHSAGTYRVSDGRGGAGGGQMRFEPLNSWPDNGNLDKARRLLWPIKKKYGRKISWADLMILSGNVALESMGFNTFGFAGGRTDDWEPDLVYWGPEKKLLASKRHHGKRQLKKPLGATRMGLIYVNPEGPNGVPDALKSAKDIRMTFGRMAMNDEETVALIVGGHTFGKAHGAKKPESCMGDAPAGASLEEQGTGWKNKCGTGKGKDTITSGLEGAWTSSPIQWSHQYLQNLYAFEWVPVKSPAGAIQWIPSDKNAAKLVPDAHVKDLRHAPIMFTSDLALKFDPAYAKITKRFLDNPKQLEKAFSRAWFKLTHRDMGPRARYVGKSAPKEELSWQDPVPSPGYSSISTSKAKMIKRKILNSGLSVSQLVRTAWASAASYRMTDMRGGANGARLRLLPQRNWDVNNPAELKVVIDKLENIHQSLKKSGVRISFADLIILGGGAAIEKAAQKAGVSIYVPIKGGRGDASQDKTNVSSFDAMELKADGFRNYYGEGNYLSPINAMIDRANLLGLNVPEMTVLVGGLRVLNINHGKSNHGVFTKKVGVLSNDFFVNILDMSTKWMKSTKSGGLYNGIDRKTGKLKWTATPVDLMFGSSSELRSIAEVYAADDGKKKFVQDFVKTWLKVMRADRF